MKKDPQKIESVIGNYQQFLSKLFLNLKNENIDVSNFELDHIAYRSTSASSYEILLNSLTQSFGDLIKEVYIRNRRIAIIILEKPITYKQYSIQYLELMEPTVGDTYKEGLEHAEFVVKSDLNNFKILYPEINFIFKDRKINPELSIEFKNGANVKLHTKSIDEVIKIQEKNGEL